VAQYLVLECCADVVQFRRSFSILAGEKSRDNLTALSNLFYDFIDKLLFNTNTIKSQQSP
jgi:hypothetical protein